ncbi:hypothetical protein HispidOSU_019600 [Sigmodon hispidus]
MSTPPQDKEMTAALVHASPARTPEACSPNLPAWARPGAPRETGSPTRLSPAQTPPPSPGKAAAAGPAGGPGRPLGRRAHEQQQRRSRPDPTVTYRRLMVPQRLSPASVLTNHARQLGASLGSRAGPHSQPFKHRRARPAGIATPWASRGPRPAPAPPPRKPAGGGNRARGSDAP